jgi:hypothetical protein
MRVLGIELIVRNLIMRNNNSSRFGKYVKILVNASNQKIKEA